METNKIKNTTIEPLFNLLSEKGVKEVKVAFDGNGDSGQVESIVLDDESENGIVHLNLGDFDVHTSKSYSPKTGQWTNNYARQTLTVETAVENLVYEFLEEKHRGWEIDGGSFGKVTFNVKSRKISILFNQRVETYETEEYEV